MKKITRYLYELENIATELIIVILSLGTIAVTGFVLFSSSDTPTITNFGTIIDSWVYMLAGIIIARELWLINRKLSHHLELYHEDQKGE
jgi:purine-cytosine permease-like protein